MKVPLSWMKDFVDIVVPLEQLASRLTLAGLEVEDIRLAGLPYVVEGHSEFKVEGLTWDPEKIVTAAVLEVNPHPNADRLVLCQLDDGRQMHTVLTGAPNLFPYRGIGRLEKPLKVAYAREGAKIYDGHQPGQVLTTLKRAKIRGVDSYSMICSEKELGISEEHDGVIILDDDAPVGIPLVDYMGDAVLNIAITPNVARDANILGVAREVAALTGQPLRLPSFQFLAEGPAVAGRVSIVIQNPELNPRFVLGLIEGVEIRPSPYQVQRRLRLAGMRPINNIVDATNYAMLEIGEPLHAFDYDVLVERANGTPTILTRTAHPGERLTTLDGVDRPLDDFTVLVCDTTGALSIAGVMGGAESEVSDRTRNILLEGAAWNFINIRKTVAAQRLQSEAAYRFSRGVHPAMAERGVSACLEYMRRWAGGTVSQGLVDNYPLPAPVAQVTVTEEDVERMLGIKLTAVETAGLLARLEFHTRVEGSVVHATAPDHRLDIGTGIIGLADVLEEIARIYGYDRIPESRIADDLPAQRSNPPLEREEIVRDLLVDLGFQEVATYRLTTPEREARTLPPGAAGDDHPFVRLANPIASDRVVMRHSLLSSLLEVVERNARIRARLALFEIAPIYLASEDSPLPDEPLRLDMILTGPRALPGWQPGDAAAMDFFDMKGILEELFRCLHLGSLTWEPASHPSFHPGKCARILSGEQQLGVFGELHPQVAQNYDLPPTPLLAADLDLQAILGSIIERFSVQSAPAFPPMLEDIALVVDEDLPAGKVEAAIRQSGGKLLVDVRLFDIFRGGQLGAGKKSLAYRLTYQAPDRTLTDSEAAQVRSRVIRQVEKELGARLRS
jgi:phenylalanyl-tRNA synthetase beta chain